MKLLVQLVTQVCVTSSLCSKKKFKLLYLHLQKGNGTKKKMSKEAFKSKGSRKLFVDEDEEEEEEMEEDNSKPASESSSRSPTIIRSRQSTPVPFPVEILHSRSPTPTNVSPTTSQATIYCLDKPTKKAGHREMGNLPNDLMHKAPN